jgi:hypothetical protein
LQKFNVRKKLNTVEVSPSDWLMESFDVSGVERS